MEKLQKKKLFLLDMDGTIYLGDKLFDATLDFLENIRKRGGRYMFLTNNSSKSVDKYIDKLTKMGIKAEKEDFCTSTDATIAYLLPKKYTKIYALGTMSFKEQLKNAGLNITDKLEEGIDCLCMGFDTELSFGKLEDACKILSADKDGEVEYIATNPDWVCPTEYGFVPDCGSVSEMIYNATGRRPKFIGKPQPEMINLAVEKSGFSKEESVIFGDRLYTDIASGYNAGISTVFVLSGEGTMKDAEESTVKPDYILSGIEEVFR